MLWKALFAAAITLALSIPAAAQDNQGTSPLSGHKGGTGNAFMQFTGPATSIKTYTLPNASETIATLTATQTLTNKTFNCANNTCTVRIGSDVTGLGTGIATFLATPTSANLRAALTDETGSGIAYFVGGALGAPSSATLTNATGLPVSTGISGFGTGIATFLATPSSANLAAALTDETGTGANVFANSPTLVTPNLGTPSAATLTNATGLPVSTGISGLGTGVATLLATPSSANLAAALTDETGTGANVFANSPTLVTPNLGTPSAATLTNATGLPVSTGISGLATGIATFLGTPSSANLRAALTDETGTGIAYFVGGALGTPSSATLTNATGLPVSTGISGFGTGVATLLATPSSANLAAALTDETGTGAAVFATAPSIVNADLQGRIRFSSFVTATAIAANQNDYTATDGSNTCATRAALRLSATGASRNVTGLSCSQAEGDIKIIHNVGSQDIVLTNQDAASTAANRFLFGGDVTLLADYSITIKYDAVTSRWRAITTASAGGGGGVTSVSVAASSGISVSGTCTVTTSGTCTVAQVAVTEPQGRLTLQAGTPVMVTSQSNQTTLRYVCAIGRGVPYFDGANDQVDTIASCEVATAMVSAASAGQVVSGNVYDVFWVNSGANKICIAMSSAAGGGGGWSSDTAGSNTARGTGFSQLDFTTRGYPTNKNTVSNCFNGSTNYGPISANRGTYLGTVTASANGQISYTFGSAAAGGGAATFGVWNYYNRVSVETTVEDSTGGYTYNSVGWRSADNSTANRVSYVYGVSQDGVEATYGGNFQAPNLGGAMVGLGIGVDATGAVSGASAVASYGTGIAGTLFSGSAGYAGQPGAGLHFIQALEYGNSTAVTFNNRTGPATTGLRVRLRM